MAGFTLIEDQVLGSAAASITFNTGLSGYTKFRLTLYVIGGAASNIRGWLRLNGDSGANYAYQYIAAGDTVVAPARSTGQAQIVIAGPSEISPATAATIAVEVQKPTSTVPARISAGASYYPGAISMTITEGEWNNTADLISSISIITSVGDFAANTRAVLEGAAP